MAEHDNAKHVKTRIANFFFNLVIVIPLFSYIIPNSEYYFNFSWFTKGLQLVYFLLLFINFMINDASKLAFITKSNETNASVENEIC